MFFFIILFCYCVYFIYPFSSTLLETMFLKKISKNSLETFRKESLFLTIRIISFNIFLFQESLKILFTNPLPPSVSNKFGDFQKNLLLFEVFHFSMEHSNRILTNFNNYYRNVSIAFLFF